MRSVIVLLIMGVFFVLVSKVTVELSQDIPETAMTFRDFRYHWAYEDFPLSIYPVAGTSVTSLNHLKAAVNFWNKQIGSEIFVIKRNHPQEPRTVGSVLFGERDLHGWAPGRDFAGITQFRFSNDIFGHIYRIHSTNVWIHEDMPESLMHATLIHELGHVLGLEHDERIGSCMFPIAEFVVPQVDADDVTHIRRMAASWPELILN